MSPGKASVQAFLPRLFKYSFSRDQYLTLKVDPKEISANSYNHPQIPVIPAGEFASKRFNVNSTAMATIEQWMQKHRVSHSSTLITILPLIFKY